MPNKTSKRIIKRELRIQAQKLMNPATKLVAFDELEQATEEKFEGDKQFLALRLAESMDDPVVRECRKELIKHDVQAFRKDLRATKLEEEMEFLSGAEIQSRMCYVFDKHGDRLLPVADEGIRHEPRSQWTHGRPLKYCRPSDIDAAIEERDVGISLDQDAREDLAVLQMAAKKSNLSLFLHDAQFHQIFRS